jgi:hypothetical protein
MDPDWNIKFLIVEPGGMKTNYVGSSLQVSKRHPAYVSAKGGFNQILALLENTAAHGSFADPDVCAKVLYDAVAGQSARPLPTRLPMGLDASTFIRGDIKKTLEELDAWKAETESCSSNAFSF